ncbi:MAG: gliding motility-associated ABC transporter substrate-binding protein GldG [Chryseolinea sp.]
MVNWKSRQLGDVLVFLNGLVVVLLLNVILSSVFFRLDLTEERRYSVKPQTREMLKALDDDVYIEIFLEGELNAEFRRLQKAIAETLEEFRIYSGNKIRYSFVDPNQAKGQKAQEEFIKELASKGIQPTNVISNSNGQRVEKLVFPGLLISYGGIETGVTLLKGNKAGSPAEEINQSIEGVEFEVARAISKLFNTDRKQIGMVSGHGELDSLEIASIKGDLLEEYDLFKMKLSDSDISRFDAIVIAKPTMQFSTPDKFALDQYIMRGGAVLFLIDKLEATMDSASRDDYFALPYNLDLDDQLFKYGVRVNPDLVQDRHAGFYPIVTSQRGGKPQFTVMDWPFFPLVNHYADHPVTRNLDAVLTRFASSIDTVKAQGIKKTPLILTSAQSRTLMAPVRINVNDLRKPLGDAEYSQAFIPVAYLLEGRFSSLYKNRFLPDGVAKKDFREESVPTKIIVVGDGDIIRNDVNFRTRQPRPLGFDPSTNYTFANRDVLINSLAHLTQADGLIQVRDKQVKIRPLDKARIKDSHVRWQIINLVMPLAIIVCYGLVRAYLRRKRFAGF